MKNQRTPPVDLGLVFMVMTMNQIMKPEPQPRVALPYHQCSSVETKNQKYVFMAWINLYIHFIVFILCIANFLIFLKIKLVEHDIYFLLNTTKTKR
jgi:hypothetical protein